jgi:hypothetical protein
MTVGLYTIEQEPKTMTVLDMEVLIDDDERYCTATVVAVLNDFLMLQMHDMSGTDSPMPCILMSLDEATAELSDGRRRVWFFRDRAHREAWQEEMGMNDDQPPPQVVRLAEIKKKSN